MGALAVGDADRQRAADAVLARLVIAGGDNASSGASFWVGAHDDWLALQFRSFAFFDAGEECIEVDVEDDAAHRRVSRPVVLKPFRGRVWHVQCGNKR